VELARRTKAEATGARRRGLPGPREVLAGLWLAATASGPAADWVRYRMLAMLLTVAVIAWSLGRVAFLLADDHGTTAPADAAAHTLADAGPDALRIAADGSPAREGLRHDLFKLPRARKPAPPPEPKTNPVELLALIELQGVLGGARPRAMIQYKRTQEAVTVSVGDDLGEFEVVEIGERSVVLKWRNELFELSL
jgi:hypothetical protein